MNVGTNKDKGRVGLSIAIAYYGSLGYTVSIPLNDTQDYTVSIPLNDTQDYDLVIDNGTKLKKVQVKCTSCMTKYGVYSVSMKSCGGTRGKIYKTVQDTDIDILFVFCTNGWMFEIPKNDINCKSSLSLSIKDSPYTRNMSKYLVKFETSDPKCDLLKSKEPIYTQRNSIKSKNYCVDCGKEIGDNATRCRNCNANYLKSKTSWTETTRGKRPSKEELSILIYTKSFTTIGKMFEVSDNTIRKWCRKYGLPFKKKDILQCAKKS